MPLHAPNLRRERILVCGLSGSGKSTTWLTIAEWLHKTKSTARVYVIDNDHAWEAARPEDGHLDSVVVWYEAYNHAEHRAALRDANSKAGRDDWLVVDMTDKLWTIAQNDYWVMAYGKEIDEIFLDSKIANFNMAGDYGSNWGVINKLYDSMFGQVHKARCHVLCVTSAEPVKQSSKPAEAKMNDAPDVIREFGRLGWKPTGQKGIRHPFHTILLMQDTPSGYTLTTMKERNPAGVVARPYLKNETIGKHDGGGIGFVMGYLVKVAKWKMGE